MEKSAPRPHQAHPRRRRRFRPRKTDAISGPHRGGIQRRHGTYFASNNDNGPPGARGTAQSSLTRAFQQRPDEPIKG